MMKEILTKTVIGDLRTGIQDGYSLFELARGWLQQGNTVVAEELLKSAASSREADQDSTLRAGILKERGRACMMKSEWETADSYYLEAQRVFTELKDLKGASESARNRANMCFQKGRYAEAEKLCGIALEWASAAGEHQLRATILNTLGAIKSITGEHRDAINTFKLCLTDFHAAGNSIREGYTLLNIGLAQNEIAEYNEAITCLNQALAIALEEKDLSLVEICYQNISKCYLAQKETNLAKSVIETARKILPGLNSVALETELNLIDCRILRTMGDFTHAVEIAQLGLTSARDNQLYALEADFLNELGLIAQHCGDTARAISTLEAAANQYQQVGMDKNFQETIQRLNDIQRGNHA